MVCRLSFHNGAVTEPSAYGSNYPNTSNLLCQKSWLRFLTLDTLILNLNYFGSKDFGPRDHILQGFWAILSHKVRVRVTCSLQLLALFAVGRVLRAPVALEARQVEAEPQTGLEARSILQGALPGPPKYAK